MKRSFMTTLPDKTGAFLEASRIILAHGGNMQRASYNKAVDAHTLFLDVEAEEAQLNAIEAELTRAGFLQTASYVKIILAEFTVDDRPGAILPVLEILAREQVSISYISSMPPANGAATARWTASSGSWRHCAASASWITTRARSAWTTPFSTSPSPTKCAASSV